LYQFVKPVKNIYVKKLSTAWTLIQVVLIILTFLNSEKRDLFVETDVAYLP